MTPRLLTPSLLRRLERLRLHPRLTLEGKYRGDLQSRRRGLSVEFADYREYQPGDDYRSIDWSLLSRLDRLYVKLYQREEDLRLDLLIDTSRSMAFGQPSKLEYAGAIAAALGYIALTRGDAVRVSAFDARLGAQLGPSRTRRAVPDLFRFISGLRAGGGTSLGEALRQRALSVREEGLTILLTDLFDPGDWEGGLRSLAETGRDVCLLHILEPGELRPDATGQFEWEDAETGERLTLDLDPAALAWYAETAQAWCDEARAACGKLGAVYARIETSTPLEDVLLRDLGKAGVVA